MRKRFDQSVTQIGVTGSQWGVIVVVARQPGATQRVIAELLDMTEAAAGRLIDRLCSEGLLVRKPRPDDRRAYSVELTGAGRSVLDEIGDLAKVLEQESFAGFSEDQLAIFSSQLGRLYKNLGLEKGPPSLKSDP